MAVADADLIDGQVLEVLELGFLETNLQPPLLDFLDRVPSDAEMGGHGLDRHVPREIQHVTLKGMGVAASLVGERDLGLARLAASGALQPLDGQVDPDRLAADGQGAELPGNQAGLYHPR